MFLFFLLAVWINDFFNKRINDEKSQSLIFLIFILSALSKKERLVFGKKWYLILALHPRQLNCFFANFIMPLFDGVEIEIDLVWLP